MQLSEAEWKVMTCVWDRHPSSARDVLEQLEEETGWAYTTVKTILSRLADKGALSVRLRANTSLYEPLLSRREARQSAVRSLMDRAFDGAFAPMVAFLVGEDSISKKDRAQLQELLEEIDREDAS